jgi:hypothetical protein
MRFLAEARYQPSLDKDTKTAYVFVIGLACRTLLLRKTARSRRSSLSKSIENAPGRKLWRVRKL